MQIICSLLFDRSVYTLDQSINEIINNFLFLFVGIYYY